jgi:hypothetical protein
MFFRKSQKKLVNSVIDYLYSKEPQVEPISGPVQPPGLRRQGGFCDLTKLEKQDAYVPTAQFNHSRHKP